MRNLSSFSFFRYKKIKCFAIHISRGQSVTFLDHEIFFSTLTKLDVILFIRKLKVKRRIKFSGIARTANVKIDFVGAPKRIAATRLKIPDYSITVRFN